MMRTSTRLRLVLVLGLVVMLVVPWAVLADNVVNDVVVGGNDTFTLGGSTTVSYWIVATGGDGQAGCNASDGSAATVTISAPANVTATPGSLTFTACGTGAAQEVVFTATAAGSYAITVSVSDSGTGTYNTTPGGFTLEVLSPSAPSDTTPPVITPEVVGTLGNEGWYTSDVTVTWTVTDDESDIISTSGCDEETIDYDTAAVTLTCEATSAGGTSSESVTIKRDATPPTIDASLDRTPAATGWFNIDTGAPTVSFTCSDAMSGLAGDCPADYTFVEGENQSYSQTIYDTAGNSASAGVSDVDVDLTAPTVSITSPISGSYLLGEAVTAEYSCDDTTSGVASCLGDVAYGASVDTSSVGSKTFTVTATDNAGNTKTESVTYRVVYDFSGFFRPVDNLPTVNVVQAGRAVPVKFSLNGDMGLSIMAAGYPKSYQITCDSSAPTDGVEQTLTAGGSSLSYDSDVDQYVYVWKTERSWAGTCRQLVVQLNDGTQHRANFRFTK